MRRRSKPLLIAPLIPLLSFLGILGLDQMHGSRYLPLVVIVWCLLMPRLRPTLSRRRSVRVACRKVPDE